MILTIISPDLYTILIPQLRIIKFTFLREKNLCVVSISVWELIRKPQSGRCSWRVFEKRLRMLGLMILFNHFLFEIAARGKVWRPWENIKRTILALSTNIYFFWKIFIEEIPKKLKKKVLKLYLNGLEISFCGWVLGVWSNALEKRESCRVFMKISQIFLNFHRTFQQYLTILSFPNKNQKSTQKIVPQKLIHLRKFHVTQLQ